MKMVSILPLFAIVAAVTAAHREILNVTSSTQDYFLLSQRELFHEIEIVESQIDAVDARFADRLDVIQCQQQQVLHEIHQVNQTLMPLQALGLVRKYCIQKHDTQLVTDENAKARLKYCYDVAKVGGESLTSTARLAVSNARTYASYQLPNNLANCDKIHSKNQTALENCYIVYVTSAKTSVNYYLDRAQEELERSLYESSVLSRNAVQCSFAVEKDISETIGGTTRAIDDCEINANSSDNTTEVRKGNEKNVGQSLIGGKI